MAIEDRFTDVVFVQYDAASHGTDSDTEGVSAPDWQPWPGVQFQSLPCLIYESESLRAPGQEFTEDLTTAIILFAANCGLPRNQTLRFGCLDPGSGSTIYYYANGKVTSPAGHYVRVMTRLGAIV